MTDNLNARLTADQRRELTDEAGHESVVLSLHGQWAVTEFGIECLDTCYYIEKERVWEPDWTSHLRAKTWVKFNQFISALLAAQDRWPTETRPLSMDASGFRWEKGHWPERVEVAGVTFLRHGEIRAMGEFDGYRYLSDKGQELLVHND